MIEIQVSLIIVYLKYQKLGKWLLNEVMEEPGDTMTCIVHAVPTVLDEGVLLTTRRTKCGWMFTHISRDIGSLSFRISRSL